MNLKIFEGITSSQVKDLVKYSSEDDLILKTTNDNSRFGDLSSYKKWLGKKRKIYTLVDEKNKLLGIIWFGKENNKNLSKEYGITFAVRVYGRARGKGFSAKFFTEALNKYKETSEYLDNPNKKIWLETNQDNIPAFSLYKKVGFKVSKAPKNKRLIMILN